MMTRRPRPQPRGITLTEILISILILGVGITSLMTLFVLGLLNTRVATRYSRSTFLAESATAELEVRDLLNKFSFQNTNYSPWYSLTTFTPRPYDPFVQDAPGYNATTGRVTDPWSGNFGAYRGPMPPTAPVGLGLADFPGPGLPVAYDPLWRQQTGVYLGNKFEARFASGIGSLRADPDGTTPSAHGLQRLTNFNPSLPVAMPLSNSVPEIFVSPEDIVLQSDEDSGSGVGTRSPIVPDLNVPASTITGMKTPMNDWKYTWMFTGGQADCTNGAVFTGDIVVFDNRPFGINTTTGAIDGETVVEAIFGYTNAVTTDPTATGATAGYGLRANRTVLLRWPASMPDPELRVGNWIADVTYERVATVDLKRRYTDPAAGRAGQFYPYQRCNWYQIAKRTMAAPSSDPDLSAYREMTVWTSTPLKAFTLLNATTGAPVHLNAALVSPYVVNVFPRSIYTR